MAYRDDHPTHCSTDGCPAQVPGSKWDQIRAVTEGWFFQRDGKVWCPKHVPEWVPAWREKRNGA